jgi:ABC-type phosphate transport system substrate-binding protein
MTKVLGFVFQKSGSKDSVRHFIEFARSQSARKIVEEAGYVPQ